MSAHIYLIIKREGSERKMYTEWYLWIVALFYYLKIFCKKFMDDLLMPLKAFFLLETCLIVCEVPYLSLLVFGEHSLLSVVFRIYFFFVVASFAVFACGKVHSTLAFWKHYVKFLRILAEFFLLNIRNKCFWNCRKCFTFVKHQNMVHNFSLYTACD